ncbi:hypothetical protein SpCBS45565_g05695 [Spizellomyces sp. 'palustris']|nr:hypothetical protein SpCBS45565_g05695 [Spizellomyces sp. 'palustris']
MRAYARTFAPNVAVGFRVKTL